MEFESWPDRVRFEEGSAVYAQSTTVRVCACEHACVRAARQLGQREVKSFTI